MKLHANAELSLKRRCRLVADVVELEKSLPHASGCGGFVRRVRPACWIALAALIPARPRRLRSGFS